MPSGGGIPVEDGQLQLFLDEGDPTDPSADGATDEQLRDVLESLLRYRRLSKGASN